MPDPDYKGEFPTAEEVEEANKEQAEFVEEHPENFSHLEGTPEGPDAEDGESDSPTPAADAGEGGLTDGGGEGTGPTGSPDPDAAAEDRKNVAETGSSVTEDEVKTAKKPAAKSAAKKNN